MEDTRGGIIWGDWIWIIIILILIFCFFPGFVGGVGYNNNEL